MPTKRCCCKANPCGFHCIANGSSPCAIESAQFYDLVALNPISPDDYCCFSFFFGGLETPGLFNEGPEGNCTWTVTDPGEHPDCDATLVISAGPEATLTMTVGAYTMVWKSVAGFNPLCTSLLTYRPELSTPPDDCGWPDQICLQPSEGCCPDYAYPDTLDVIFHTEDDGECLCVEDGGGGTLTRVSAYTDPPPPYRSMAESFVRYTGTVTLGSCGHSLAITMECYHDIELNHYRMRMLLGDTGDDDCPSPGNEDVLGENASSCDPFIFSFTFPGAGCCPDGLVPTFSITVFDPS